MIDARARELEHDGPTGPRVASGWVFAHFWTSGPDAGHDRVFRMLAMKRDVDGTWIGFDRFAAASDESESAWDARSAREYGELGDELRTARPPDEVWPLFRDFVADGPLVCLDGAAFRSWYEHLDGRAGSVPRAIGLNEMVALLAPGRLANLRERLVDALLETRPGPPRAIFPPELASALAQLVARFFALEPRARALTRRAWERALDGLAHVDPPAARRLSLAMSIVTSPSRWTEGLVGLPASARTLPDQGLPPLAENESVESTCAQLEPRCAHLAFDWSELDPLPTNVDPTPPFDERDRALLDDVFRVHLPGLFARGTSSRADELYRASQHEIATEIARTIGSDELLLVHAPTGTGKTLAYLLPALLWSRRNGLRVGIATYTRALQEQAMERDVPLALRALACAGEPWGFRVALLKGRENYLCWRAFLLSTPTEDDAPEAWLGWSSLLLFALGDGEGDLDRFPTRSALGLASESAYRRSIEALVKDVRARTGCCMHPDERRTCAAELARRRAERSHVVITNHAFVLTRTEFFRHVVFDECEHLHEQAASAWSHELALRSARAVLGSLHRPRSERSRAPLDRLSQALLEESPSSSMVQRALSAWEACYSALEALGEEVMEFEHWRIERQLERHERDRHALLREYAESDSGGALLAARTAASTSVNDLDAALAEVTERLETIPVRGRGRLRRSLDGARGDLAELIGALESWLPVAEGRPALRQETFYDAAVDAAREIVLHARVLLPNEYLGRNYHPMLSSAVFLSATTWLRQSFDGALGYLGLDRAAAPDPAEERPGRTVRCCRAPEVFDYSRVLVAVPRDAPPVATNKEAFLDYVRRFLAWLGERTRGRILALFTNKEDVLAVGRDLAGFFRARRIPLWYQGMEGTGKEELSELFRSHVDSVLLGVDTFWYGADFPGETLEYLVIVRLPYGVPDRYHHAQCAAIGQGEQRRRIYLPRALAKFRQGFGRLMRRKSDRGAVFVLDQRVLDPRHRLFLAELPIHTALEDAPAADRARLLRASTDTCLREALEHMGIVADVRARGLSLSFEEGSAPPRMERPLEDLPF